MTTSKAHASSDVWKVESLRSLLKSESKHLVQKKLFRKVSKHKHTTHAETYESKTTNTEQT